MLRTRLCRGSALLTALFLVTATTLLIAGGATYVTSHTTRAQTDVNYAAAIQLAEAGVNYELWNISRNGTTGAHQLSSPYAGTITGVPGRFSVGVTSDPNGSAVTWTAGQDMYIVATGTVGNVSRKIRLRSQAGGGAGFDLWGTYGLYGINSITITNDFNLTGAAGTANSIGSNGPDTISSGSNFAISGTIDKGGSSATLTYPSWYQWNSYLNDLMTNRVRAVPAVAYPTVDTLVGLAFPSGWTYLKSDSPVNRANGTMQLWATISNTKPSTTPDAVWPAVDTTITWSKKTAGTVYARRLTNDALSILGNPSTISGAMGGGRTIFMPPGDYYFEQIYLTGNTSFVVDNASGPVRIWMDNPADGSTLTDQLTGSVRFNFTNATTAATNFRIFSNKHGSFLINGNAATGGFYFVNSAGDAGVRLGYGGGTFTVNGAVIGNIVRTDGPTTITAPPSTISNSGVDPGMATPYYGFDSTWQELPITAGGVVFTDGSSN